MPTSRQDPHEDSPVASGGFFCPSVVGTMWPMNDVTLKFRLPAALLAKLRMQASTRGVTLSWLIRRKLEGKR